MYIYKLFRDEGTESIYQSAYLNSVYDEIKRDLTLRNKYVQEQFRGGFKVVTKNDMLFWLKRTVGDEEELIMYRDDEEFEWYRIEKILARYA